MTAQQLQIRIWGGKATTNSTPNFFVQTLGGWINAPQTPSSYKNMKITELNRLDQTSSIKTDATQRKFGEESGKSTNPMPSPCFVWLTPVKKYGICGKILFLTFWTFEIKTIGGNDIQKLFRKFVNSGQDLGGRKILSQLNKKWISHNPNKSTLTRQTRIALKHYLVTWTRLSHMLAIPYGGIRYSTDCVGIFEQFTKQLVTPPHCDDDQWSEPKPDHIRFFGAMLCVSENPLVPPHSEFVSRHWHEVAWHVLQKKDSLWERWYLTI